MVTLANSLLGAGPAGSLVQPIFTRLVLRGDCRQPTVEVHRRLQDLDRITAILLTETDKQHGELRVGHLQFPCGLADLHVLLVRWNLPQKAIRQNRGQ